MTRRLTLIRAIFVKDFQLFWPLALLTIAVILTYALYDGDSELARNFLPLVAGLVSSVFLISLVQQDAPASLRHEWLTRPIGGPELLLAKALLAAAAVLLPAAIGPAIAAARDGASIAEALLSGLSGTQLYLWAGLLMLMVAAVTSTLLEAAGVLIVLFLLFALLPPLLMPLSGLSEAPMMLGSGWIVLGVFGLILLAGGVLLLWLQYATRRTNAARGVFGGTIGLFGVTFATLSWGAVLAVQRLEANAPIPDGFAIALAPGCFETARLDPIVDGAPPSGPAGPWTQEQRRDAGFGAVGFWSAIRARNLPAGWRMTIARVQAKAIDRQGTTLTALYPARYTPQDRVAPDGQLDKRHAWLLAHQAFDDLAHMSARLRLDYDLTLIAPTRSAQIAADGVRRAIAGLGACTATVRSAMIVEIGCFKAGRQPDLLTAHLVGAPADQEIASGYPSFAPAMLQLSSGQHHKILLRQGEPGGAPRVTITAYEARSSAARSIVAPGLIGGPACRIGGQG